MPPEGPTISITIPVTELHTAITAAVKAELASLGGELLSLHGPTGRHPDEALAKVGGYLLQRGT